MKHVSNLCNSLCIFHPHRDIIRRARTDGSCGTNVLYLPTKHNEGSSERPLLGHNFSRHTTRQLLQGGVDGTFGGGKGCKILKSPCALVASLISRPLSTLPLSLCTSSYCRINIASRWIANKPGFGRRDLHHRRYEREREKGGRRETACTLMVQITCVRVYDPLRLPLCMHVCTYLCTRLCGERCEKVLRSRYLFFGSIEPPLMIIGAM